MTRAIDPRTGEEFGPDYPDATPADVDAAVRQAADAAADLGTLSTAAIAVGLRAAADLIDDRADAIAKVAESETALGHSRLAGEVGRTTNQLRMFAELVETGEHLDAVVTRCPQGGPANDVRRVNRPLGVVAVFGASNFPIAFDVAGGDTASALAAGCPVVAKAHPAHPNTSQLVADTLESALTAAGLPDGAVQLVHGAAPEVGAALVTHRQVAAVGFTGSTAGGRALFDLGAARPQPIPVYAEQGSLNPVVIAPSALRRDAMRVVVEQVCGSITGGWGQFCTKPGLILTPAEHTNAFVRDCVAELERAAPGHLLTSRIRDAFEQQIEQAAAVKGVHSWRGVRASAGLSAAATLLHTDAETFITNDALREEMFGPAAVVVSIDRPEQIVDVLEVLGGHLTGTVRGDADDPWVRAALMALEPRVGRLLADGVPTGVAVVPAMHHGGPYPATTSVLHTSVGTAAIRRFLRPVAYQEVPDKLLPPPLADNNPWRIQRTVDGRRTADPIIR